MPNSCAADYLETSTIGADIKRRKNESVDLKRYSPVQSGRNLYRSSERVTAKVTQHTNEYPVGSLKTRSELSLFPNAYSSPLSPHTAIPIPVPPNPLSSTGNTTDLLASAQSSSVSSFRQEQPLLSSHHTVDRSRDLTPRSTLTSASSQAEGQGQELDRPLDPISPQHLTWAPGIETLISGAYGGGIFNTLSGQPSDPGSSRSLAFPVPDIYPVQSPAQRQLPHESVGISRFPECSFLDPWSQHQSISLLEHHSRETQVDMAITHSSFRVTIPATKPLDLQPRGSEQVEDKVQSYDRADAEYVIVPANPNLNGYHITASLPGQVEKTPDATTIQAVQGSLGPTTSRQVDVDTSWEVVVPGLEADEAEEDGDEDDDSQTHPGISGRADARGSLDEADNSASTCRMPKRRQTFNEIDRQETSRTRNIGACLRCKMQRIRCNGNPEDPEGPCLTCKKVSKTSKKVIHRVNCVRYKLQEITLYRTSGLGITKRWQGVAMRDVDFPSASRDDIRCIQMEQGLCSEPMTFRVRMFEPQEGDVLHRKWLDKVEQIHKLVELPPYALADIHETKDMFVKYIDKHAFECLGRFISNTHIKAMGESEKVIRDTYATIRDTYSMALAHYYSLGDNPQHDEERLFLFNLFRFWFALRHTTGSSWIAGTERLGMTPVHDPSYPDPLKGKLSTPRMVVAQFDSINTQFVLRNLAKKLLEKLERFMKTKNSNRYLTIFVSCFILLHEISHMTEDRYRHGRDNGVEGGFSLPKFVRDLQESANVILIHWHYYKSGLDPLLINWDQRAKTPLADLSQDEIMFLINTWQRMKDKDLQETVRNMWEVGLHFHTLYFVAQMFEQKWSPKKTFAG